MVPLNALCPVPCAAYDVEDKKVVIIASTINIMNRYVFESKNTKKTSGLLSGKQRCKSNRFGRTICFRHASNEQIKLLESEGVDLAVLDDRYKLPSLIKSKSGFTYINKK
jgi:hypothetical protein